MSATEIDQIRIAFNEGQMWMLNVILATLMFSVALEMDFNDFRTIFRKPKSFIVGIIFQLLVLPALSMVLIHLIQPTHSIALGMLLVAVCPGGNVSNYFVHLAKGNTALSILMTSSTTLIGIAFTPFAFSFWSDFLPDQTIDTSNMKLDPLEVVRVLSIIILLPLLAGMILRKYKPGFTEWLRTPVSKISMLMFLVLVVAALWGNRANLGYYISIIFWIVFIQNSLAFALGWWAGLIFRLPRADTKALTIESGVHNSGLGIFIVFTFFGGLGGMMLVAAWWGIWHLIAGFGLARFMARIPNEKKVKPSLPA